MKQSKPPTPTSTLIHRLRLMAESGGMITRDRKQTILDSADRLESSQNKSDRKEGAANE